MGVELLSGFICLALRLGGEILHSTEGCSGSTELWTVQLWFQAVLWQGHLLGQKQANSIGIASLRELFSF